MTQRTAPWENWHLERGFELLRTFGLVRWGLGGSDHVEGTGEKLSFASQAARYSPTIPHTIKAGYLNCKIRPYIPNPLRCFKCQRFGHSQTSCRGQLTCSRCASVGHASTDCSLEPKCFNCSESHQSDSKLCSKWKLEKKIQEIKTSKNISYPEARKLILPQISQTYSQATKSSTTTTTTQTDDSITKIVCPPLKLLQPLSAVLKPTMPFKIPTVTKLSASTEAQLLPTTSSSAAKSSESQPPVPSVITASSASISLITSTTTMFTALSNKTHPSALKLPHPIVYLLLSYPLYPMLLH
ncbi:uncharacterized protein TNCV_4816781 [Trichonephila clavipes]|nr:uncharacterized protein TNCV_4816781 [Trichonephila clavipes]